MPRAIPDITPTIGVLLGFHTEYADGLVMNEIFATCPQPACCADLTTDGIVGFADLAMLLGAWNRPSGDLDGDGTTGFTDLVFLLAAWGPCP